jgi:hypothetical protein
VWSKLEGTSLAVDIELDLLLANVDRSSQVLRKGIPRISGGFSLSPISSTMKPTWMKWCLTFTGTSTVMLKG